MTHIHHRKPFVMDKSKSKKINNIYFDKMVSQIYASELQLKKTNTPNTEAPFLDLHLTISYDIVSTKI